ncbi:MAG: N utilization substance protein B [Phycisphaerae bacterium]
MTKQLRHQARRAALQGLYQLDIQRLPDSTGVAEYLAPILAESELTGAAAEYARRLAAGTWARFPRYDEMIAAASSHWDVSRMAVVDRNILRLALHELVEQPDVPAKVVIDEAIEIGREFGSADTAQFVNGVLDAIWKNHPVMRTARAQEQRK